MRVAYIKYQHDAQSQVVESNVLLRTWVENEKTKREYVIEDPHKILKIADGVLRNIHSGLIWEVDTKHGGWCETWTEDGNTLMYRHDAERKEMEVKPEKKGRKS